MGLITLYAKSGSTFAPIDSDKFVEFMPALPGHYLMMPANVSIIKCVMLILDMH